MTLFKSRPSPRSYQKIYSFKKDCIAYGRLLLIVLLSVFFPYRSFSLDVHMPVDFGPWGSFAPKIKECALGQYSLPNPVKIALLKLRLESMSTEGASFRSAIKNEIAHAVLVYEVYGWVDNLCHVYIRDYQKGSGSSTYLGHLGFQCQFTLSELEEISTVAEKLAEGKILLTGEDPNEQTKGKACKAMTQNLPPSPHSKTAPRLYFIK